MHRMRQKGMLGMLALLTLALAATTASAGSATQREYIVVYERGADGAAARKAVERAGGEIVKENRAVGVATVRSRAADFTSRARAQPALFGAAPNKAIGQAPKLERAKREDIEQLSEAERAQASGTGAKPKPPAASRSAASSGTSR